MLKELLEILRHTDTPVSQMGKNFQTMLGLAVDNIAAAGKIYFGGQPSAAERSRIYKQDIEINKLERAIRKQVVSHLSIRGNVMDVPYCLVLMTLAKDAERLGDYAKNLSEVSDMHPGPLPEGPILGELKEIRASAEEGLQAAAKVLSDSDRERALGFLRAGKDLAHRCDLLVGEIAKSSYDANRATALVLGTRYYKRISGHIMNILSSVVMPLHKIDYFDEDELQEEKNAG